MAKRKTSRFAGKVSKDVSTQQQASSNYGYLMLPKSVSVFKEIPGGRASLDIIPYVVSDEKHMDRDVDYDIAIPGGVWYKKPYKAHRQIGVNNDSVVCLTTIGKKCPICEYRSKMTREGADRSETDALKPSLRNLYVVIPLKNKDFEEKMHIWDISQAMFQKLLNEELEENNDFEVFPDPEVGLSLKIRFEARTIGKSKPFAEASRIDFEEREEAYAEEIMEKAPNLDKILKILSYKELEALFLEIDDEDVDDEAPVVDDEDDDEEEAPKSLRKKKKVVEEPEDDDDEKEPADEPEDDDDEDEEEEAPKPKKKTAPAPKKIAPTKSASKSKCPHDHVFGTDNDEFDDCDTCKLWDECAEQ